MSSLPSYLDCHKILKSLKNGYAGFHSEDMHFPKQLSDSQAVKLKTLKILGVVGGRKGAGNTSSVGHMLSELEWQFLESRREQSSLTFFYKIHSGTVYIDKDKYLTSALGLKLTRASQSHDSQYHRYLAYSDALKNLFFSQNYSILEQSPLFCSWGPDRR